MSEFKKARLDELVIGTHSGTFHADEALAVNLLRSLDDYKSARELKYPSDVLLVASRRSNWSYWIHSGIGLIRTRDANVLASCDIVVDVGGQYDPATHRYDHHQRGFEETYSSAHRTKLSSAGLIYKWELI